MNEVAYGEPYQSLLPVPCDYLALGVRTTPLQDVWFMDSWVRWDHKDNTGRKVDSVLLARSDVTYLMRRYDEQDRTNALRDIRVEHKSRLEKRYAKSVQ